MNSRQPLLLAAVMLLASTGVTLTARTNDSTSSCERTERPAEQPAESSGTASGNREENAAPPAREEPKPAKPATKRPVWPPPSELIA
jgi:hypothetical protein